MLFFVIGSGTINAMFDPILNGNSVEVTTIHLRNQYKENG